MSKLEEDSTRAGQRPWADERPTGSGRRATRRMVGPLRGSPHEITSGHGHLSCRPPRVRTAPSVRPACPVHPLVEAVDRCPLLEHCVAGSSRPTPPRPCSRYAASVRRIGRHARTSRRSAGRSSPASGTRRSTASPPGPSRCWRPRTSRTAASRTTAPRWRSRSSTRSGPAERAGSTGSWPDAGAGTSTRCTSGWAGDWPRWRRSSCWWRRGARRLEEIAVSERARTLS